MSTYGYNVKITTRSKGKSAMASSAYNSGQDLYEERTGTLHHGSRSHREQDILFQGVMAPDFAPSWMNDREKLWNQLDVAEDKFNKYKDRAQTARRVIISLPHELTNDQRHGLVRDFIDQAYVSKGIIGDYALHAPNPDGDERNFHAHINLTMRCIDGEGFTKVKNRDWNSKDQHNEWRALYAEVGAQHLAKAGFDLEAGRFGTGHLRSYDHKEPNNLKTQYGQALLRGDIEHAQRLYGHIPEPKMGPVATQMERDGKESFAGADRRRVKHDNDNRVRNAELANLRAEHAKKIDNVSDLADPRRREVDAEELRRARGDATTGEHWQRELEEQKRREQASGFAADIEAQTKGQLKNLQEMREARDKLSPEEILRREYATNAERDQKLAEATVRKTEDNRELAKEAKDDQGNARLRWAEALGKAQGSDWLTRSMSAVAKEGEMAAAEHRKMADDMKKETDPLKREIIWQGIVIHHAEYRVMADSRQAGQSDYIAGKPYRPDKSGLENGNKDESGSENGNIHRAMAQKFRDDADAARAERSKLIRMEREEFHFNLKEAEANEASKREDDRAKSQMRAKAHPPHGDVSKDPQHAVTDNVPGEAKKASGPVTSPVDDVNKAARAGGAGQAQPDASTSPTDRQTADAKRQQTEADKSKTTETWKAPTKDERDKANGDQFGFGAAGDAGNKRKDSNQWTAPTRPGSDSGGDDGGGQTRQGGGRGR